MANLMSEAHTTLEVIAPTIEEAIEKGLQELGVTRDDVETEVLDEGNRGFLGMGSRDARIRLIVISEGGPAVRQASEPVVQKSEPHPADAEASAEIQVELTDEEENILAIARETVSELLEKMRTPATVSARYGEMDERRRRPPVLIDIRGKDLGPLIGKKAQTLDALQYISHLMVSKEIGRSVRLLVDVEGYRERREEQLVRLAHRMADQAVKTGRRQVLEPMPPNERRIVHITLRDDERVTTESIGEGPKRKLTIIPED